MRSMRFNENIGKPIASSPVYLSQRADFPKLYYVSHEAKDMTVGEEYNWSAEIVGATINGAYDLIK